MQDCIKLHHVYLKNFNMLFKDISHWKKIFKTYVMIFIIYIMVFNVLWKFVEIKPKNWFSGSFQEVIHLCPLTSFEVCVNFLQNGRPYEGTQSFFVRKQGGVEFSGFESKSDTAYFTKTIPGELIVKKNWFQYLPQQCLNKNITMVSFIYFSH